MDTQVVLITGGLTGIRRAAAVAFDEASFVTGLILDVDGGKTAN